MVDEPFIEATQDEKQFRVVKDRLRWFNAVMRNQKTSVPFSPWGQHIRQFLGTAPTDRGVGTVAARLEQQAREVGANLLVVNGYNIINDSFLSRGFVSFYARQLGFDSYRFTSGGEPAVQLVKHLG